MRQMDVETFFISGPRYSDIYIFFVISVFSLIDLSDIHITLLNV